MNSMRPVWLGAAVAVLLMAGLALEGLALDVPYLRMVSNCLYGLAVPFFLGALLDIWMDARQQSAYLFQTRQRALAMTPHVLMAEAMKQMHPSAIEVLKLYGRTTWQILPGSKPGTQAQYILYGTQCTWDFIAEFLRSSNGSTCVPEWRFANDGAKKYAPFGMTDSWCSDREQYQQFTAFLYSTLRVTLPHGNQPAAWIGPWNPEMVAKAMGIRFDEFEDEDEDEAPEVEEAPKITTTLRDAFPQAK